jgi:Icc-related predicted phosphoesterase
MRIQIASDLHLELLQRNFPDYRVIEPADADVLVLAGDIHRGTRAIDNFRDWPVPVIYVHGNHEGYGLTDYAQLQPMLKAAAQLSHVRYLECGETVLQGVRFLGCCLWTDYRLQPDMREAAMQAAERCLYDHVAIGQGNGERFTAQNALAIHTRSREWLEQKLDTAFDGPTVVVTHHGPHAGSIHPRYTGDLLNAAFISELSPLVEKSSLWIHGHVHDSFDYAVGTARVVTNPRGYAKNRADARTPEELQWENAAFNPSLVIEV